MARNITEVDIKPINLGNIVAQAESIKSARVDREGAETRNKLAKEQYNEFMETKPARQAAAETARKASLTDLSIKKLDLATKTIDAMTNELVTLSPNQYESFYNKWKDTGINMGGFPEPSTLSGDPEEFRALQRQYLQSAETAKAELLETIKQKGAAEREQIKTKGAKEREVIAQQGATTRANIKAGNPTPTGDMAYFITIKGRKPKNEAEFKAFRTNIAKDTGLTPRQKELKTSYFTLLGRADSAKRGEGQFISDPNKAVVAKENYERAQLIADEFIQTGGDPSYLGLEQPPADGGDSAPEIDYTDEEETRYFQLRDDGYSPEEAAEMIENERQ